MIVVIRGFFIGLILSVSTIGNIFGFQADNGQKDSTAIPKDWFLKDPEMDKVQGLSVEKAYSLLTGRPSKTVIVAVIDTGVDFDHEDLKDVMWVNEREIAGNGIDDDKNGYTDDVHGWNFIGGATGNVKQDTYELTREYARLKSKYENIEAKKVSKKNKAEYDYWLLIKDQYTKKKNENEANYNSYTRLLTQYKSSYQNLIESITLIKTTYKVDHILPAMVDTIKSANPMIRFAKGVINSVYKNEGREVQLEKIAEARKSIVEQIDDACNNFKTGMNFGYNPEFNSRLIVGDNYDDLENRKYGNNEVKGHWPVHGTHVAGIIAANRTNSLGIKGIADNVKIMAVRVVPNGDERDKDIANGIRYAVDNGARIINMSFGKDYSPQKAYVDNAVKYAESKGVLLIHASGNDSDNNDIKPSYPMRFYQDGKEALNWIEVGASSWGAGSSLTADFTNYGKKNIDFFAPGVKMYSTTPGNKYEEFDGTSVASPATAGVAAMLMSYFPNLTANQVREILRQSSRKFDNLIVDKPGSKEKIKFSELSISGGLVNAYEAVQMALSIKNPSVEK